METLQIAWSSQMTWNVALGVFIGGLATHIVWFFALPSLVTLLEDCRKEAPPAYVLVLGAFALVAIFVALGTYRYWSH